MAILRSPVALGARHALLVAGIVISSIGFAAAPVDAATADEEPEIAENADQAVTAEEIGRVHIRRPGRSSEFWRGNRRGRTPDLCDTYTRGGLGFGRVSIGGSTAQRSLGRGSDPWANSGRKVCSYKQLRSDAADRAGGAACPCRDRSCRTRGFSGCGGV